jgi:hypothetical protein
MFGTSEKPRGGSRPNWWGTPSSDGGPVRTSAKSLECDIQFQEEMMRKNSKWTGLPTMVMALGLVAWTVSDVKADPTITYDTSGAVGTTGITDSIGNPTNSNIISFVPITTTSTPPNSDNSFTSPSNFSLGYFQLGQQDPGVSTTYSHTPFNVTLHFDSVNGQTPVPDPNGTPITITGELNGTATGSDVSNVKATFNPPTNATSTGSQITTTPTEITDTFQTGSFSNTMTVPTSNFLLVPSSSNFGRTTLEANLTSTRSNPPPSSDGSTGGSTSPSGGQTVPEPTSIVLFAAAIAGLALHRYRARRAA